MRSPFLNGKQLGVVSVLDFHVPLTKTLDLSGEFINYETDWNHIPGPAGLHSKCINVKNPLEVAEFFAVLHWFEFI